VAGAVDVRVVALLGLILDVRGRDGDAARLFFRRLVDLVVSGEGGAAGLRENLAVKVAPPVSARTLVIAAVKVVLPWST